MQLLVEKLVSAERSVTRELSGQALQECLRVAATKGVRLVRWSGLDDEQRATLRERCRVEINPGLTPLAMTLSPGHPLPHLPHLGLSLAVVFRRTAGEEPHLADGRAHRRHTGRHGELRGAAP